MYGFDNTAADWILVRLGARVAQSEVFRLSGFGSVHSQNKVNRFFSRTYQLEMTIVDSGENTISIYLAGVFVTMTIQFKKIF